MSACGPREFEAVLRRARQGDTDSLGRLLETYRHYLTLMARLQIGRRLQGKADASDVVQETFLHARDAFPGFRGSSEHELMHWLRRILVSRLADLVRRFYEAQCRDVRLERRLDEELDHSSHMAYALVHPQSSPSRQAARQEVVVSVANALERLPADYREVLAMRHFDEQSFVSIARRMSQSVASVERLWIRALGALRKQLGGDFDDRFT